MFTAWGSIAVRYRRTVVLVAAAFTLFAGVWGTGVFGDLVDGGFDDEQAESVQAVVVADQEIGRRSADLIVVVQHPEKTVDDPSYATDFAAAAAELPSAEVVQLLSYFTTGAPDLVSQDRRASYAAVTLSDPGAITDAELAALRSVLADRGYQVWITGQTAVFRTITETVAADITRAELISMPILLVLLVVIFGSVVAASLPLLVGGIAILGSFTMLRLINYGTDVSIFAVNLVTLMGLGLAIDYGLLIVGRFREELAAGRSTADAVSRTVQTAGRTVTISALTVAVSLAGLTIFPMTFLKSMAFGGMSAVLVAALAAVLVLPAVLAMLGPRVDRLSVRRTRPHRHAVADPTTGFWFRLAQSVMRRPGRYLLVSAVILGVLFVPFFGVKFGGIDQRMLPATSEPRVASAILVAEFGADPGRPIVATVSLADPVTSAAGRQSLDSYLDAVSAVDGVNGARVAGEAGSNTGPPERNVLLIRVACDPDTIGALHHHVLSWSGRTVLRPGATCCDPGHRATARSNQRECTIQSDVHRFAGARFRTVRPIGDQASWN